MPRSRPRIVPRGGVLDPVATWREEVYTWPCLLCACMRNLRGLLRETCANCGHFHQPPTAKEKTDEQ